MPTKNQIQSHTKVVKWGNSLAIRLSGALREVPNFKQGELSIAISREGFSVKKIQQTPKFTEAELLADLTPENCHANLVPEKFLNNET